MTQKSASRRLRDQKDKTVKEYFNTNKVYDELNEIHVKIVAQIKSFGLISQLAKDTGLTDRLEDKADVNQKTTLLSVDLQKIIADINQNYTHHKGKTGGAKDADEYMGALIAFQNYQQITTVIEGAIFPTAADIFEEFSKAEKKLIADKKAQEQNTEEEVKKEEKPVETATH